jgi:leucyl-tRNA---protein transferase
MRVKVEQDAPDSNGSSLLRSRPAGPGLPPVASALRPFYRTASLPCPYLDGQTERKLITEISGHDSYAFYNELSRAGFRRSHHLAYRPACAGCAACLPVRVDVARFETTRSLRRTMSVNRDLAMRLAPARATTEQYRVFTRYQRSRHAESDMASMTYGDYRAMVEDSPVMTVMLEHRKADGTLVAGCLADLLDDGLSAVYSFFDPAEHARSLGTAMILALVAEARKRALPYVYLGYWIGASRKMAYKTRFQPLEALTSQGWAPISR